MADALISSTVKVTLERALSLASDRIGMLVGFKKDVASMTRSLRLINAVLADAEAKQNQDGAVQAWLECLEEVAYDATNVLDELKYESLRHKVESRNRHKLKVCCFFSFSNINLAFRWRMASKVRDIKLELSKINQEASDLGLASRSDVAAALPAAGDTRNRQTDSSVAPMIGRAKDESNILEMLLRPTEKVVSVLPINGMGGLGKTTLAKSIYNKQQIDEHFNKKLWVCVSKKVPIVDLFKLILLQLTEENFEVDDRNIIVGNIRNQLGGKRYFLVLDDVWDDDQALWDDFFSTLKGLNPINPPKGSWCLITTRSRAVADEGYPLGGLRGDHCWSIIKRKVVEGEEVPNELDAIKDRAIQICNGLPLVASVLGGLLRLRKDKWRSILEDRLLNLNGVMQILKLSFDNLPSPAVKKCFAYCSIFPQDTEMEGDMLIELWMAEGFLHAGLENKTMEEIGEYYLEILLQSSLLEEIRKYGRRRCYKMHDMVHEVSKSIMSKSTKFINSETGSGDNSNQVRCLVIDSFGEGAKSLFESRSNLLHTLFLSRGSLSDDMLMKLKNLHVLNLSGEENQNLPISIGKLRHLRYINFERSRSETLPESICKLYNLQTLRLKRIALKVLPKGMCNLISLRHLHYYTSDTEFQMPLEMGRLTCLQALEFFKVGREKGRRIGELGSLKNLKGELEIRNLELVNGKEEAEEANLFEKANLFRLQLEWARDREGGDYNDEDVLDGLRPHQNLEELVIENFMGDQFPRWLMELPTATTLPRLARLEFKWCHRCKELLPLQNFASLKELQIWSCDGLTNLPGDMLHSCASLQKLWVAYCNNLISFPLELQRTPSLLTLELFHCPKLKTSMTPKGFGFLTSLRELSIGPFSDDGDDHENSSIYNEFDWSGLISSSSSSSSSALRGLELIGLPHVESLPPQIQYLTTLTSLCLWDFEGIKALPDWFGNFAALEVLVLNGFKELGHLPSKDAVSRLTKLKRLSVSGSPLLKERCTSQSSGPDSQWSKVSHIQDLHMWD
ncbi:putative disease resistance protein RGA3 isoform X2 [Coffea eugenioides]|uniref:putative disease resistance protein RGA3 isoform X2 n=1 Tax=Coffea eugenioides TaxID=49369 RepID=UPI000F60812F|nr:putative disease resistance protein RGA3 isoform X2 [Coffea eugenioides]XP_027183565.1 putative disease resistance protein RGA3 isoform X2 [Coffea eugenioides]XP_027183632.1 putative disease resistance protein RGA3 isoform X2 [Coffea eugenioides]XP_027183710.1 putative disease resistance protein RGA3 isoform X2 [Coffea eugenioides]XP_027183769.1 putative disease resistance protein RGA3 isoform X2 [Coffea eugenioides]XP_027183831.1 putative disease resistance protein RGA3 isoform X2 [Coffea 